MNAAPCRPARRIRGSVAIECALLLPVFFLMLGAMLFFGRVMWHYTVAEKAAHDAARFLAAAPVTEMRASGGGEVPVVAVARKIAEAEVAELNPGVGLSISILCYVGDTALYWDPCSGLETPKKIMVRVTVSVSDPFFGLFITDITAGDPILLRAVMATDYVGS